MSDFNITDISFPYTPTHIKLDKPVTVGVIKHEKKWTKPHWIPYEYTITIDGTPAIPIDSDRHNADTIDKDLIKDMVASHEHIADDVIDALTIINTELYDWADEVAANMFLAPYNRITEVLNIFSNTICYTHAALHPEF